MEDPQIKKLESKALSNDDLFRLTDGKANIMSYSDLNQYKTLDEALGKHGSLIVLYESQPRVGHWVAVNKVAPDLVEFFDPYSVKPDKEFDWVSKDYKKFPYLSQLLKESPYKLSYNEYKFQKLKQNVNTCGRWCSLRVILKHLPLNEFFNLMKGTGVDLDYLSTYLTENLIP